MCQNYVLARMYVSADRFSVNMKVSKNIGFSGVTLALHHLKIWLTVGLPLLLHLFMALR